MQLGFGFGIDWWWGGDVEFRVIVWMCGNEQTMASMHACGVDCSQPKINGIEFLIKVNVCMSTVDLCLRGGGGHLISQDHYALGEINALPVGVWNDP